MCLIDFFDPLVKILINYYTIVFYFGQKIKNYMFYSSDTWSV